MRTGEMWWPRLSLCVALVIALIVGIGCRHNMAQNSFSSSHRDINEVLRAHDRELLAVPGVVGVYVALLDDGKTPCLKIMLVRKSSETERALPRSIEGYPVTTEVTGEIRPLGHP